MINIRKKKKLLILGGSSLLSYIWCNAVCEEFDIYLSNNIKITSYLKFPVLKINLNSPENFAKILYECIDEKLKDTRCKLLKVRLYETKDLFVDYWK